MNSALYDSVIALALSSFLLIFVLLINPVFIFESSLSKLRKVSILEKNIKSLYENGYFGKLAKLLEIGASSNEIRNCLKEIYEKIHPSGVAGLRLLINGRIMYIYGSIKQGWIIRMPIPTSKDSYVLEFIICGE